MEKLKKTGKRNVSPEEKTAMKVSANSMAANLVLSVFKLIAGIVAHSGAMISDAIHSASDVFSTIIVMIGVRLAGKEADEDHPYGHERLECVAAILLSVVLFATGAGIGMSGIKKIIENDYANLSIPGTLAMAAAIISIVVKEAMYWYTRNAAKKIDSSALMADAWHHRSDALSSIGSLAGIVGARLGFPICDPIASVIICAFILKAAIDIFRDAVSKMTDRACDAATVGKIRKIILDEDGVIAIDKLQTRIFGSKSYVDVEILVDGEKRLYDAHRIPRRFMIPLRWNWAM